MIVETFSDVLAMSMMLTFFYLVIVMSRNLVSFFSEFDKTTAFVQEILYEKLKKIFIEVFTCKSG